MNNSNNKQCKHLGKGNLGVCYNENSLQYEKDCPSYNTPIFKVFYQGEELGFEYGADVYIFHTLLLSDRYASGGYDTADVLKWVSFIETLYLSDSNRTPLGDLTDFVMENYDEVIEVYNEKGKYAVLDLFYQNGY